jgi:hypothetical protein
MELDRNLSGQRPSGVRRPCQRSRIPESFGGRSCSGRRHVLGHDWLGIEIIVNVKVLQ